MIIILVAFHLIVVHGGDGQDIEINPREIVSMRGREEGKNFAKGVECMINTSDGKFIAVAETCNEVYQKIEELEKANGKK
jgi:uncharacterized protein YlzI (FlbEa/FlbD family)